MSTSQDVKPVPAKLTTFSALAKAVATRVRASETGEPLVKRGKATAGNWATASTLLSLGQTGANPLLETVTFRELSSSISLWRLQDRKGEWKYELRAVHGRKELKPQRIAASLVIEALDLGLPLVASALSQHPKFAIAFARATLGKEGFVNFEADLIEAVTMFGSVLAPMKARRL